MIDASLLVPDPDEAPPTPRARAAPIPKVTPPHIKELKEKAQKAYDLYVSTMEELVRVCLKEAGSARRASRLFPFPGFQHWRKKLGMLGPAELNCSHLKGTGRWYVHGQKKRARDLERRTD